SELLVKFQAQEEDIVRLKERVHVLEDTEGNTAKQSRDDASIKGRSINEGEAAAKRIKEQQEKEDMRMNEQIARDAEVASIHAEEELQGMIDSLDKSNETIANDLVKYQDNYSKVYKFQSQQRRPMTKKQKREYYMAVIKSNLGWTFKDFKGMTFEEIEAKFAEVWNQVEDFIPMGSKEETERLKRKDLLKQLDREDLNQLWALVKEYLSIRPTTCEKEMELWVELKRMYEPDPEDQLWTLTQNFIHAQVEWKLYDLSGVHHLTAKDREIFMLVKCSHWQYKFPLPVKVVATTRRLEMPLPEVCTAMEEKKKKLP
nr:hypothetical protein [Tanacetum cinerariifolium]